MTEQEQDFERLFSAEFRAYLAVNVRHPDAQAVARRAMSATPRRRARTMTALAGFATIGLTLAVALAIFVVRLGPQLPGAGSSGHGSAATSQDSVSVAPTAPRLPDLTELPPVGNLLASASGIGKQTLSLPALEPGWQKVTIRFACTGGPNVAIRLTDASGALLMGVAGCNGSGRYGASFTNAVAARDGIRLDGGIVVHVTPADAWVIAVWAE
jgi:hypothetical protein